MIRVAVGVLLVVAGIAVGFYVSIGLFFIAGANQIIEGIKSPEGIHVLSIAKGCIRIFAGVIAGWLPAVAMIIPGIAILRMRIKRTVRSGNQIKEPR